MNTFKVKIKGITPLLQDNFLQSDFEKQWAEKRAVNPDAKQIAHKLYINKEGAICQPAVHIEKAMQESAKKIRIKGAGKASYSKLFGAMVTVEPALIPHKNQEYGTFATTAVNNNTRPPSRIMSYRPVIDSWSLEFTVTAEDEIPSGVIKEALVLAGKYNGLGAWRPQKAGKFGRFEVVSFK